MFVYMYLQKYVCVQFRFKHKSPATRNRTRDHLIAAAFYSQMLYQLSYSRLEVVKKHYFMWCQPAGILHSQPPSDTVPLRVYSGVSGVSACLPMCMCACLFEYMHACVCLYVSIYVCMYVCIHVCMYVCMYVCVYVCM